MPKTFPLSRYPVQYGDLLMRVATQLEPITIPFDSPSQALTLRGKLYAFRRACERSPLEAKAIGVDPAMIGLVLVQLSQGNLVLSNRNYCREAVLLDEVLGNLPKNSSKEFPNLDVPDPEQFLRSLEEEKYK